MAGLLDEPRVSVVLPFRGQGPLLAQACQSLLAQSLPAWEALLVEDGSDSGAKAVAQGYCRRDARFRLLAVEDRNHAPGPWLARNLGIAAASAPLIAFLDADDLWHPCKLERQLQLHAAAGLDLSVTAYHRFLHGDFRVVETRIPPAELSYRRLLAGNPIPLASVIIRRDLLGVPEGLDAFHPERHEDYGLWLRLFRRVPALRYGCLPEPLMAYRLHEGSISRQRYRSVFAVEKLLRDHIPARAQRLGICALWLGRRFLQTALGSLAGLGRQSRRLDPIFAGRDLPPSRS